MPQIFSCCSFGVDIVRQAAIRSAAIDHHVPSSTREDAVVYRPQRTVESEGWRAPRDVVSTSH